MKSQFLQPGDATPPELTVLLPVYNGALYLEEAINSILTQTFTNFELLVIDDDSIDGSPKIIKWFAAHDARVRFVSRKERGLVSALNQGLALSRANIIARMDADDIAMPHRLERQMLFMKSNPCVDICGTGMVLHETDEELYLPEDHAALCTLALFNTPLYHPTVIMRKKSILAVQGYSSSAPYAEDYDLWERMLYAGMRFANLKEILLRYRVHPRVNRAKYYAKVNAVHLDVCARQLARLGLPTDWSAMFFHRICCVPLPETSAMRTKLIAWLKRIKKANDMLALYPPEVLETELARREQALSVLQPSHQPSRWVLRQLRHCVHLLLLLVAREKRVALEGLLASCWWEIKYFLKWKKHN